MSLERIYCLYAGKSRIGGSLGTYPLPPSDCSPNLDLLTATLESPATNRRAGAIYVHIPFCDSICTFCAFNRWVKQDRLVEAYLEVLKKEMQLYLRMPYVASSYYDAVYLGGGSPTCLSEEQLCDLLKFCRENFKLTPQAEITVEACTRNFAAEKQAAALAYGANRVSFGIQTFKDSLRSLFNLQDSAQEAAQTVLAAHSVGYGSVDIDLMYNLPGQTMEDWQADLLQAASLQLENISFFPLHVHPQTKLARQLKDSEAPPLGPRTLEIDMYLDALRFWTEAGYLHQHISKFVLPGKDHRYNTLRLGPYDCLALGPGPNGNLGACVYKNYSSLQDYTVAVNSGRFPVEKGISISEDDERHRFMVRGLSLLAVDKHEFRQLFGRDPEHFFPNIMERLHAQRLIDVDDRWVRLTRWGTVWGHNVCAEFCSPEWRELHDERP